MVPLGWAWPSLYILYVALSSIIFMCRVCPGCVNFGRPTCGSGFGLLAAKMSRRVGGGLFPSRFRASLPFLAGAWVIPVAGGALAVMVDIRDGRAPAMDILPVVIFAVIAFGILPFTSKRECHHCAMRDRCPGARVTREGRDERR